MRVLWVTFFLVVADQITKLVEDVKFKYSNLKESNPGTRIQGCDCLERTATKRRGPTGENEISRIGAA